MEGCFTFQWGRGLFFKWGGGGGASFLSEGGQLFRWGGGFEKNCWMGGWRPPCLPHYGKHCMGEVRYRFRGILITHHTLLLSA